MAEIIEILFEDIDKNNLLDMLSKEMKEANLISFEGTNDGLEVKSILDLIPIVKKSSKGSIYLKISNFYLCKDKNSVVGIQLLRYDNQFDLSLDLEYELLAKIGIKVIRDWAQKAANDLNATAFYCGYEPATDSETRFFTGKEFGPLELNSD